MLVIIEEASLIEGGAYTQMNDTYSRLKLYPCKCCWGMYMVVGMRKLCQHNFEQNRYKIAYGIEGVGTIVD